MAAAKQLSVTLTEKMMMRFTTSLAVVICLLYATPAWGRWYLDLSAGGGLGDQTLEANGHLPARVEFDAVTVWRMAVGAGVHYASGFEVGSEVAWSQRGASITLLAGSIFRGVPTTFEYERSYLDVSVGVRQGWNLGPIVVSVAAAPRLSWLLEEQLQFYHDREPENAVLGIDPELRFAFCRAYAWVKYYWDLTKSYESATTEMRDRSLFFGLGLRIP